MIFFFKVALETKTEEAFGKYSILITFSFLKVIIILDVRLPLFRPRLLRPWGEHEPKIGAGAGMAVG